MLVGRTNSLVREKSHLLTFQFQIPAAAELKLPVYGSVCDTPIHCTQVQVSIMTWWWARFLYLFHDDIFHSRVGDDLQWSLTRTCTTNWVFWCVFFQLTYVNVLHRSLDYSSLWLCTWSRLRWARFLNGFISRMSINTSICPILWWWTTFFPETLLTVCMDVSLIPSSLF